MKESKTKTLTTQQYADKIGVSRIWASTLLSRMYKYGEPAPKVKAVVMMSNRYFVTLK